MIEYNLINTKGLPFSQKVLSDIQSNILDAQSLSLAIADTFILSGCIEDNGIVGTGMVCINGEVLPFSGGALSSTVYIENIEVSGIYKDGSAKPLKNIRTVRFGTGTEQYNWSDFRTSNGLLARIEKLEKMCAPIAVGAGGTMMFWNKPADTIPAGWQEVVNWRSRMPIGYDPGDVDFNTVGQTAGEKKHQLTIGEMPAHKFKNGVVDDQAATASGNVFPYGQESIPWTKGNIAQTDNVSNNYVGYTNTLGNDQAHNNMPPYRVVLFIEFIG